MNAELDTVLVDSGWVFIIVLVVSLLGGLTGTLYRVFIKDNDKKEVKHIFILWSSSSFLSVVLTMFLSQYTVDNIMVLITLSGLFSFWGEKKILGFIDRINIIKVIFNMIPKEFLNDEEDKKISVQDGVVDEDIQILINYLKNIERIKLDFLNIYISFRKLNKAKFNSGKIIDLGPGGMKIHNVDDVNINIKDKLKLLLHEALKMDYFNEITAEVTHVDNDKISLQFINTDDKFEHNIKYWIIENTIDHLNKKEGV